MNFGVRAVLIVSIYHRLSLLPLSLLCYNIVNEHTQVGRSTQLLSPKIEETNQSTIITKQCHRNHFWSVFKISILIITIVFSLFFRLHSFRLIWTWKFWLAMSMYLKHNCELFRFCSQQKQSYTKKKKKQIRHQHYSWGGHCVTIQLYGI